MIQRPSFLRVAWTKKIIKTLLSKTLKYFTQCFEICQACARVVCHRRPSYLLADRLTLAVDLHNTLRILLNCVNKFVNKFRTPARIWQEMTNCRKIRLYFPLIRQNPSNLKSRIFFLFQNSSSSTICQTIHHRHWNEWVRSRISRIDGFRTGFKLAGSTAMVANQNIQLQPIHKLYNKYFYTITCISRRCELRYVMIFPSKLKDGCVVYRSCDRKHCKGRLLAKWTMYIIIILDVN